MKKRVYREDILIAVNDKGFKKLDINLIYIPATDFFNFLKCTR